MTLREVVEALRASGPAVWHPAEQVEDGLWAPGYYGLHRQQSDALTFLYETVGAPVDPRDYDEVFSAYRRLRPDQARRLPLDDVIAYLFVNFRADHFDNGARDRMFDSGMGLALFERWLELEELGELSTPED